MTTPVDRPTSSLDHGSLRSYLEAHLSGAQTAERVASALRDDRAVPIDVRKQCSRFLGALRQDKEHLEDALALVEGTDTPLARAGRILGGALVTARALISALERRQPFVEVELLAVGVAGKRQLWSTLRKVGTLDQRFADLPIDLLIERANSQERELIGLRDRLMMPFLLENRERAEPSPQAQELDERVDDEADASFPASDAPSHWAREEHQ